MELFSPDQVHSLLGEAPLQVKGHIARLLDSEPNTRPTPADMLSWRWMREGAD
jgi:hypothetical protein